MKNGKIKGLRIICFTLCLLGWGTSFVWSQETGQELYKEGMDSLHDQHIQSGFTAIKASADLGYANGMAQLGILYEKGRGTTQDFSVAKEWYEKSIQGGSLDGLVFLGQMYIYGNGMHQDFKKGEGLIRKAALQGSGRGMYALGEVYASGLIDNKGKKEAKIWYQKAVKAGYDEAKFALRMLNE